MLLHGYGDSKSGALAWAPAWWSLGFDVLVPDLRAHGESGGRFSTGGAVEPKDVAALLDQLYADGPVVLAGISFGGLVATRAAALRPDVVAGVVLDSPILSWADATARWGELYAMPPAGAAAHRARLRLAARWFGFEQDDPPLDETLAALACPSLAILPTRDAMLDADARQRIGAAATATVEVDAGHNLALAADAVAYEAALASFVEPIATITNE